MNFSKTKHILDRKSLQCSDNRFKNQSIITVMDFKMVCYQIENFIIIIRYKQLIICFNDLFQSLREMCYKNIELRNCTCTLSYIALDLDEVWRPMYSIDCNNLNFTRLPKSVPDNTTMFYAQHNQVIKHHMIRSMEETIYF